MAANSSAVQTGSEKILTDALTTVNGVNIAADLIEVQRFKLGHGVDGDYKDATAADPLPITGAVTGAFFPVTQPVSGTVAVSNMVAQGLTDTQIRATALPVSGTFFQATQPVSLASTTITGSVAVTGGLTDTQLRATAVPVSGSFFQATQPVSLATVAVTNAGTFAVQAAATLAAETTKVIGTVNIAAGQSVVVGSNGVVSTVNSSAVNLAAAAVFTGTSEDVSDYAAIVVSIFASHASATDGLSIQQSTDGTNWDHTDVFSIPATTGKTFSVAVQAKFMRVVYTNGATLTSSFRLQTIYSKGIKKSSTLRPQDARTNDNDFEEMLSYLMGYNGVSWDRLRSTIANGLVADVSRIVAALPTGANTIGAVTGPAAAPLALDATQTNHTQRLQAVTTLTTISAANTAVTLTLPAVAAQFHYITRIRISMHNTSAAAVVGSAVTLAFTSSNVPGSLAWTDGNALAAGTSKVVCDEVLTKPIKSTTVNTASTIVAPACGAGVLVRITAYYYTAA